MKKETESVPVPFPSETMWFNYFSIRKFFIFSGGESFTAPLKDSSLPCVTSCDKRNGFRRTENAFARREGGKAVTLCLIEIIFELDGRLRGMWRILCFWNLLCESCEERKAGIGLESSPTRDFNLIGWNHSLKLQSSSAIWTFKLSEAWCLESCGGGSKQRAFTGQEKHFAPKGCPPSLTPIKIAWGRRPRRCLLTFTKFSAEKSWWTTLRWTQQQPSPRCPARQTQSESHAQQTPSTGQLGGQMHCSP